MLLKPDFKKNFFSSKESYFQLLGRIPKQFFKINGGIIRDFYYFFLSNSSFKADDPKSALPVNL
jgi:hypothetical protein